MGRKPKQMPQESLWGEEFNLPPPQEEVKKVLKKVNDKTDAQKIKSKLTPLSEKIEIITQNVHKVLGHYKDQMVVIKDKETFHNYISAAIGQGIIAIDTETNNTVNTVECILMGLVIYTPGQKNGYVPVHHVDYITNELLPNQLTEKDIREELNRLLDNNTYIVMHNAIFDIQVIYTTCGVFLPCHWDTMVGARLLNENEPSAGLKQQYIDKIDPDQEKYSIEALFEGLPYAIFPPELFAYYASTDGYMTYKLYEYQVEAFKDPEQAGMFKIFRETEMNIIPILAKMQLKGVAFDHDYQARLSKKYNKIYEEYDALALEELHKFDDIVAKWRLTPEANYKSPNKKGDGLNKSKNEQLEDPISVDSPTQLAILLYDILKAPVVSKDKPRGTGVEELKSLQTKMNLPLIDLILKKRNIQKLLNTFVDKLPGDVSKIDDRVHASFGSVMTDTGRFNSSSPNLSAKFLEAFASNCK